MRRYRIEKHNSQWSQGSFVDGSGIGILYWDVMDMGETLTIPISTIPSPKIAYTQDPDKIKYLTPSELSSLLQVAKRHSSRDHALLLLSYYHGLRISEVGKLQLSDYDPQTQRIHLRRSKGGLGYSYRLADECVQALRKWIIIRGSLPGPLFPSRRSKIGEGREGEKGIAKRTLHGMFVEYAKEAGLPEDKCHFHTLRHTIAITLVEKGVPMVQIADWLGHRSMQSTMIYAKVSDMARDATAESLYDTQERLKREEKNRKKEKREGVNWGKDKVKK